MNNKIQYFLIFLFLITIAYGCKRKIYTDFTYSPDEPVIGDSIFFTNLSGGGEDFDWTFRNERTGSVARSVKENPTRIFTIAGYYSVTLRVDSNDNNVRTKQLYVWDSIPNITCNKEKVEFYTSVTFSADAYNPFSRTKKYQWLFSTNAGGESLTDTVVNGVDLKVSYDADPLVYFTKKHVTETVKLRMTIGDSIYTTEQIPHFTFTVEDAVARSLLMARKNGNVLRQRIFEKGEDEVEDSGISAGAHPFNIISSGEQLFIFDAGTKIEENANWESDTSGDGSIRVANLRTDAEETIISNAGTSSYFGFYNGYVDNNNIYWTDRNDYVYQLPKTASRNQVFEWKGSAQQHEVPYYVATDNSGQFNGGIYFYDDLYYRAKGDAGKGLYRFQKTGEQLKVLLSDYSIRAFVYDRIRRQIYFSSTNPVGLYVSNMDGLQVRKIDDAPMDNSLEYITGIVLDADAQKLFWAYRAPEGSGLESGIKQINVVYSDTEWPEEPTYLNYEKDIYGITLDNNLRLGKD